MQKKLFPIVFVSFLVVLMATIFLLASGPAPARAAAMQGVDGFVQRTPTATGDLGSAPQPTATQKSRMTPTPTQDPVLTPTPTATQNSRMTPTATSDPILTPTPTATVLDDSRATPTPIQDGIEEMIPLMDMVNGETYKGFEGGLYPGGTNAMPAAHYEEGLRRAAMLQPLDVNGNPNPNGKMILLVVGMSNTHREACGFGQVNGASCNPNTLIDRAESDPDVNNDTLFVFDGARGSQVANKWIGTNQPIYEWIDTNFGELGLSRLQVQAVWIKLANPRPLMSLPSDQADAYELMQYLGDIVRTLKEQYPNLQMIFLSSRIYAGYTTYELNPEPYAYEYGFSVKWLIEAQIDQMASGGTEIHPVTGDLNYNAGIPWLAWGPYLWANGLEPRSDGLTWAIDDYDPLDLTHPSEGAIAKVGALLLDFFKNSPHTRCWFLAGQACGGE